MPGFKGQYNHSVDNKGRVSFPAKLRKTLNPQAQERFTILRGLEPCLYLYPEDEWQKVEEQLSRINSFTKEGRTVKRNFLRFAEDLSLDNQNRIPLPSQLTDWAGIDGKAIFIGSGERIEIWSPAKLDEIDAGLDYESYQELFERVMTDNENNGHE
ncbi:MAG TPA: division/cell wall cluster transcriptional repressor MraZ [Fodinibius sp.]|nr:division/cell wall cluster transcriptional repressor MraZ [Fodinibius sp.]